MSSFLSSKVPLTQFYLRWGGRAGTSTNAMKSSYQVLPPNRLNLGSWATNTLRWNHSKIRSEDGSDSKQPPKKIKACVSVWIGGWLPVWVRAGVCVCERETSVARTSHDCHAWTREREREVSTMGASKICSPLSLSLSLTLNSPTLFFSYEANFQVSGAWEVDEGRISVSPFRPKSPKIIVFCREQFLVIVVRCLNWFWAIFYYYVLAIISDDWSVKLKIGPRVNYIFGHFLLHSRRHWRILVAYEWRKHLLKSE